LFRPYRDVRFSKDKTPYKTHQGVWFADSSRYLEISAAGLRVAGGYWRTTTEQVQRLRRGVADDVAGPALERALTGTGRAGLEVRSDRLVRVPAGYERDHPRADLLRMKTLTVGAQVGAPEWLATSRTRQEVARMWKAMTPVIAWLDTHVGRD